VYQRSSHQEDLASLVAASSVEASAPHCGSSPSYAQVGNDNLVKPVKGPLVYKAAAQQDDLPFACAERKSVAAPPYQGLNGPVEIGNRNRVQQSKACEIERLQRNRGLSRVLGLGKEERLAQAGIRNHQVCCGR
jgi:hypothetical protein